jgi:hypothetical protein
MYQELVEDRLSAWIDFRQGLKNSNTVLKDIANFWGDIRTIPFNHKVDPYNQYSWPSPWDIIVDNTYDELTLAIIIGYTIKLTEQYKDSKIEIRTLVDINRTRLYNLVYVDDLYVLNYDRFMVINTQHITDSFFIENLVELARPR